MHVIRNSAIEGEGFTRDLSTGMRYCTHSWMFLWGLMHEIDYAVIYGLQYVFNYICISSIVYQPIYILNMSLWVFHYLIQHIRLVCMSISPNVFNALCWKFRLAWLGPIFRSSHIIIVARYKFLTVSQHIWPTLYNDYPGDQ